MWRAIYHEIRRWAKASRRALTVYNRTEITVETEQILVIRRSRAGRAWCAECGREVDMVRVNEARVLSGDSRPSLTTQPMLPGSGGGRGWHWSQSEDGAPLVCLESIRRAK